MEINIEQTQQFNNIITNMLDSFFQDSETTVQHDSSHIFEHIFENMFDYYQLDMTLQHSLETHDCFTKNDNVQLKIKPKTVVNDVETHCCICIDCIKPNQPVFQCEKCNDIIHYQCMNEWIKMNNTCPKCRTEIDITEDIFNDWIDNKLNL